MAHELGARGDDFPFRFLTHPPIDSKAMVTEVRRSDRYSLAWRLPLLIGALVSVVLGTFLWATYREVTREQLQTAGARAQAVSSEIAGSLVQSTQQRLTDARRLVSTPAVQGCLRTGAADACELARRALGAFPAAGPEVIELWTSAGARVLTIAKPPAAESTMPGTGAPAAEGVGALQIRGHLLYAETAVDVLADSTASVASSTTAAPLGFVVFRRPLAATPSRDLINRLAGSGGAITLGNKAGDVWTDLASAIAAPPIDLKRPGVATYRGGDGRTYLGALADIRDTPWALWVEFPESAVLAPARAFLSRMLLIALVFLAAAAVLTRVMTGRITTPLSDLTDVSEAIAGGEFLAARRHRSARRNRAPRGGVQHHGRARRSDASGSRDARLRTDGAARIVLLLVSRHAVRRRPRRALSSCQRGVAKGAWLDAGGVDAGAVSHVRSSRRSGGRGCRRRHTRARRTPDEPATPRSLQRRFVPVAELEGRRRPRSPSDLRGGPRCHGVAPYGA